MSFDNKRARILNPSSQHGVSAWYTICQYPFIYVCIPGHVNKWISCTKHSILAFDVEGLDFELRIRRRLEACSSE